MRYAWTPEEDALLGTASDRDLADRLGLHADTVGRRRRALGIASYSKRSYPIPAHEWTGEEVALLGKVPDEEVARRLGLSYEVVGYRRRRLGIPPCRRPGRTGNAWTPETEKLLGAMSDGQVATLSGQSRAYVAQRRRSLGIPAFSPPRPDGTLIRVDAQKIRARREALGLTRFALAGHNTALAAHLGMLENGAVRSVTPKTLRRLCKLLRCTPEKITATPPART